MKKLVLALVTVAAVVAAALIPSGAPVEAIGDIPITPTRREGASAVIS